MLAWREQLLSGLKFNVEQPSETIFIFQSALSLHISLRGLWVREPEREKKKKKKKLIWLLAFITSTTTDLEEGFIYVYNYNHTHPTWTRRDLSFPFLFTQQVMQDFMDLWSSGITVTLNEVNKPEVGYYRRRVTGSLLGNSPGSCFRLGWCHSEGSRSVKLRPRGWMQAVVINAQQW